MSCLLPGLAASPLIPSNRPPHCSQGKLLRKVTQIWSFLCLKPFGVVLFFLKGNLYSPMVQKALPDLASGYFYNHVTFCLPQLRNSSHTRGLRVWCPLFLGCFSPGFSRLVPLASSSKGTIRRTAFSNRALHGEEFPLNTLASFQTYFLLMEVEWVFCLGAARVTTHPGFPRTEGVPNTWDFHCYKWKSSRKT